MKLKEAPEVASKKKRISKFLFLVADVMELPVK